ncbi:MAG: ROK family protein [Planctomycetes bacterium]|nr:ROK family protein [Planctomycetota bacterium]
MYLGIEIGGTKLQLGVGHGDGRLLAMERRNVDIAQGGEGIRAQIRDVGRELAAKFSLRGIGVGFGGPIDAAAGTVVTSHQVEGWTGFPLARWLEENIGLPAVLGNDADMAALAEACYGAGRDGDPVFYVTVGTGIGGGLVINRRVYNGSGWGASEIGHLRPGIEFTDSHATIESLAAGPGIARTARATLAGDAEQLPKTLHSASAKDRDDLRARANGDVKQLTAKHVAEAAAEGNGFAQAVLARAAQVLGWAIAQVITLNGPKIVVIGGGVALAPEPLFLQPVREAVAQYVFPPARGKYEIRAAELGEEMVVHGALALAAERFAACNQ